MTERLERPVLAGQMTIPNSLQRQGANQFAGRTTLGSGQTSVVVSTTAVKSDSIFRIATQVGCASAVGSLAGHIVVNSIVDSVSFSFARHNDTAQLWDDTVMWEIVKTTDTD